MTLNEQDWLKLRDFNKIIAKQIQPRLPSDWYLTIEDIEGAVYDTFIKLLNNYKEGAMSPTSYCWQFGEQYTYRDLMREYKKLKNQVNIDELYGEDKDDDEPCKHKYGVGEVESLTVDEREEQNVHDEVQTLMSKANLIDRTIMQMFMEGKTLREIGSQLGLSKDAVAKRLKKYKSALKKNLNLKL